jgi:transposase-like protein
MTTTTNGGEVVLKTDVLGRVRTPAVRRQSLLEEFGRSGLSGAKFAALAGVKYSTFANWVQQRRRQRGGCGQTQSPVHTTAAKMRWLETVIEEAQTPGDKNRSTLRLELPGGASVQIRDAAQLGLAAALLAALEKPAAAC